MNPNHLLSGLVFALIWSSAFTSAKIAMFYAPPFLLLSIRFLIAGLVGVFIAKIIGQTLIFSKKDWSSIIIFGLCQNTIYLGLNFMAMKWIDASMAVVIASLLPLAVAFLSWIFVKDTINLKGFFGLILGAIGVIILMKNKVPQENEILGIILCFGALVSLATATIRLKHSSNENILMMVGIQMLVGSVTLFPISLLFETWIIEWTWGLILSFLYTTFFPGLLATVIWFKLLREIGPLKAATFHFLNPFFGVLIAFALLDESLLITDIIGVLIITIGIIAVQINKKIL